MSLKKFQRTKFRAYACLGAKQKSKRKYRRCKGRHNKTRQKWKSRPPRVEIGYKRKTDARGLIEGKKPVVVKNIKELNDAKENEIVIIGAVGIRKKTEIARESEKRNIRIVNLNVRKFLKRIERIAKHKEKIREEKQKIKNKKEEKKEIKEEKPFEKSGIKEDKP